MAKKTDLKPEDRAKQIAEEFGVKIVYSNSKGEFFTQLQNALNSEGGKKEKVTTYNFDEPCQEQEELT